MEAFPKDWLKVASTIPTLLLALTYQMNFFPIYKGLSDCNDNKMSKASLVVICCCSAGYFLVGILGFSLYGANDLDDNFLANIPYATTTPILYFIMYISFFISIYCSFPIMFFGGRNNFIAIIQVILTKPKQFKNDESHSHS